MSTSTSPKPVTVNCTACQTVNPGAGVNSVCSNCGESLGMAVLQHSIDEVNKLNERMREVNAPSFTTFNGFGTTLLDYREREDGDWEASRWVIAAGLPLAPLASYVIRPKRQENSYGRMESYFGILGRVPLSPARILRVYGLVALALAPVILGFMNSSRIDRAIKGALGAKYGGIVAALAMVGSVAWGVYVIFFLIKNDSKAYKRAGKKAETA
ncbi:MAG TPA: hypothetical protein VGB98_00045 [Pyrinomonadaceae bacterium]|jgi:hypothetical protein